MNSSFDDKDYSKILHALEPRHAPATSLKFEPPVRRSFFRPWLKLMGRVAAVLLIGITIGFFLVRPNNTVAAGKVIELGLSKISASKECRINMMARVAPSTPTKPFRLSPTESLIPVEITYRAYGENMDITIGWVDKLGEHKLEILPDEKVKLDDNRLDSRVVSKDFSTFTDFLYHGSGTLKSMFDPKKIKMTSEGDLITIKITNKDAEFIASFSDSSGRLLSFRAFDNNGNQTLMLETTSITYK